MPAFRKMPKAEPKALTPGRTRAAVALMVTLIGTLVFIWGNSLASRDQSLQQSGWVAGLIRPLVCWLPVCSLHTEEGLMHFTRKLAHFAEYFLLGGQLAGLALVLRPLRAFSFFALLLIALLVATVDELLQFISARAPMVADIVLDGMGASAGIALVLGIDFIIRRRKYGAA